MPVETRLKTGKLPPPLLAQPAPPPPKKKIHQNNVRKAKSPLTISDTLPAGWRRRERITPPASGIPYTEYRTDKKTGKKELVHLNRSEYCFDYQGEMGDIIVCRPRERHWSPGGAYSNRSWSPASSSSSGWSSASDYTDNSETLVAIKDERSSVSPFWDCYELYQGGPAPDAEEDETTPPPENPQPPMLFLRLIYLLLHILLWTVTAYTLFILLILLPTIKIFTFNTVAMCHKYCIKLGLLEVVRFKLTDSVLLVKLRATALDPFVFLVGITFGVVGGFADYFT